MQLFAPFLITLYLTLDTLAKPTLKAPLPGYTVGQLTWEGPVTPGGPNTTLIGTMNEIYAQISTLNPDYVNADGVSLQEFISTPDHYDGQNATETDITPEFFIKVYCDLWSGRDAYVGPIETGLTHLKYFTGGCKVGKGPGICVPTWCKDSSAIWLCSEYTVPTEVGCDYVDRLGRQIVSSCKKFKDGRDKVQGKAEDTDSSYSVIIASAEC